MEAENSNPDNTFVHLCQPDSCKSCGACCGLYNYAESGRESLICRLRWRTALFPEIVKSPGDLDHYSNLVRSSEDQARRYEVIYCCEYLGFLDPGEKRVGCLLHPLQNGGVDLRGVSFYGRELCDGHFCPSYTYLTKEEKLALIFVLDDWYLYGLCVTDIDLVKSYFRMVGDRLLETPHPEKMKSEPLRKIVREFFELKLAWPYSDPAVNRLGKYFFDGSEYRIDRIDYEALGCKTSRFDSILLSLSSRFTGRDELLAAEKILQGHIDAFVEAYSASR
ncbi:MAG: hypothetical protein A4E70_00861 [Syntrophus sp. PtaU1.Bin005]|jgi:hypothetical protein|uniref:hypothetical protein n=1 Tax=Syntrophus buswellii TaxID=43774 RepID=UPI0009C7D1AF|nr:MAG: hypothetical protein A4E69_00478 [Syntrophus sp. PtaB.Bin138]OPY82177.1 MAG: hypothetical protein A4E70_00861 [Syntrophus sp. PtaU1.Bin005]